MVPRFTSPQKGAITDGYTSSEPGLAVSLSSPGMGTLPERPSQPRAQPEANVRPGRASFVWTHTPRGLLVLRLA